MLTCGPESAAAVGSFCQLNKEYISGLATISVKLLPGYEMLVNFVDSYHITVN